MLDNGRTRNRRSACDVDVKVEEYCGTRCETHKRFLYTAERALPELSSAPKL